MFRKIIKNISYSPALVEAISRLAVQLKREEKLRKIGVGILILAVAAQVFLAINPTEGSNLANQNDTLYGGFQDKQELLKLYDKNTNHLKDVATKIGITKKDIQNTKLKNLDKNTYYRVSMSSIGNVSGAYYFTYNHFMENGEYVDNIAYIVPTNNLYKNYNNILTGESNSIKWFGINPRNGNLVLKQLPSTVKLTAMCKNPHTNNSDKIKDNCPYTLSAYNQTQGIDAIRTPSKPNDHITYQLTAKNDTDKTVEANFSMNIEDILEYATILDSHGGTIDRKNHAVHWPNTSLDKNETITHKLTIKILHNVPGTGVGLSNKSSYDCTATAAFGNILNIDIDCPFYKKIEGFNNNMPLFNNYWLIGEIIVLVIILYLHIRSRHLKEEVRLIRKDINSGAI